MLCANCGNINASFEYNITQHNTPCYVCKSCVISLVREKMHEITWEYIDTNKKTQQHIGVEVEAILDIDPTTFPKSVFIPKWSSTFDGSIRYKKGSFGVEYVSPPIPKAHLSYEINKLRSHFKEFSTGIRINSSCGLHVHVGLVSPYYNMSKIINNEKVLYNAKKIAMLWLKMEPLILAIIRQSRLTNKYIMRYSLPLNMYLSNKMLRNISGKEFIYLVLGSLVRPQSGSKYGPEDFSERLNGIYPGVNVRYSAVNFYSLLFRGTIEFRPYHATLNVDEIEYWIEMCSSIVNAAKISKEKDILNLKSLDITGLLDFIGLSDNARNFFTKKIASNSKRQIQSTLGSEIKTLAVEPFAMVNLDTYSHFKYKNDINKTIAIYLSTLKILFTNKNKYVCSLTFLNTRDFYSDMIINSSCDTLPKIARAFLKSFFTMLEARHPEVLSEFLLAISSNISKGPVNLLNEIYSVVSNMKLVNFSYEDELYMSEILQSKFATIIEKYNIGYSSTLGPKHFATKVLRAIMLDEN